jgi:hypothetical protein
LSECSSGELELLRAAFADLFGQVAPSALEGLRHLVQLSGSERLAAKLPWLPPSGEPSHHAQADAKRGKAAGRGTSDGDAVAEATSTTTLLDAKLAGTVAELGLPLYLCAER